jgi:hypothetical protein
MKLILSSLAVIGVIMTLLVNAAMALDPATVALMAEKDAPARLEKNR